MSMLYPHPVVAAVAALLAAGVVRFVLNFISHRRRFKKLPGPPHHPFWGHLLCMNEVQSVLPKRVHPHVYPYYLRKKYNLPLVFYLDLYPFADTLCIVLDPEAARDVNSVALLDKHPSMFPTLEPVAGKTNLFLLNGSLWKRWRSIFNPGFATQHIIAQTSMIVDCTQIFVRILDKYASTNKLFRMEEEATKLTVDVIGKIICDHEFNSLSTENEFVDLMRKQLSWAIDTQSLNPLHIFNPLRPLYTKHYKKCMDNYIGNILDERFASRDVNRASKTKNKSSIDLALEAYIRESGQDVDSRVATMDAEFRRYAINHLEILLFAGHDTTATTACYVYHMLSKHPEKLTKLRQELDDIFGSGVNAAEQIKRDPYILNQCEYTTAVIKETLRLWPPASSAREGRKGYFIKDPTTGDMLPTEGFLVWTVAQSMHRAAEIYGPDADEFIPERFLAPNADKIPPDAYRPFERGPRVCIGQEVVMVEMKVVLALTIREFDVRAAYDELATLNSDGTLWAAEKSWKTGPQQCFGDEMYQVLLVAAKPIEGMPARVKRRDMKASD